MVKAGPPSSGVGIEGIIIQPQNGFRPIEIQVVIPPRPITPARSLLSAALRTPPAPRGNTPAPRGNTPAPPVAHTPAAPENNKLSPDASNDYGAFDIARGDPSASSRRKRFQAPW